MDIAELAEHNKELSKQNKQLLDEIHNRKEKFYANILTYANEAYVGKILGIGKGLYFKIDSILNVGSDYDKDSYINDNASPLYCCNARYYMTVYGDIVYDYFEGKQSDALTDYIKTNNTYKFEIMSNGMLYSKTFDELTMPRMTIERYERIKKMHDRSSDVNGNPIFSNQNIIFTENNEIFVGNAVHFDRDTDTYEIIANNRKYHKKGNELKNAIK